MSQMPNEVCRQILPRSLFNNETNNTMTKENAAQCLPLVQALAEGKVIEYNTGTNEYPEWIDLESTSFDDKPEYYRIKPEPREWWIVEFLVSGSSVFRSKEDAEQYLKNTVSTTRATIHHVREVI